MTTVEILRMAKELLVKRGWWQGGFVAPGKDVASCPLCAEAAVNIAATGEVEGSDGSRPARMVLDRVVGGTLFAWNDSEGRTLAEVLAAFDRAIALATPGGVTPGGGEW